MMDRHVARHVCVSDAVAEFAATSIGLQRSKLVVIPNGVDVTRFEAAKAAPASDLGIPPGAGILLCVGRLDRQKRFDWLIRRMPDLACELPNHHLVLVGQGPEEGRLRRMAHEAGVAACVHFAGWRPDIPGVLAAADVLLLTSAWEGMPNVVLEAMAAARPVVATSAEGVAEILGPLATTPARQLVNLADAGAFVDAVVRLASDPTLAEKVGIANRRRVEREFTMERMVQRYCDLYRELL
jgi:starch synthase (maltosyl-transferring)